MTQLARRGFLLGIAASLAAPAIVRAGSLMPIRATKLLTWDDYEQLRPMVENLRLHMGDVITFSGVEALGWPEKTPTGTLRQFVVTSVVEHRFTFYPAIETQGHYKNSRVNGGIGEPQLFASNYP